VLLLDGHQSRMKLPFLEYINNPNHLCTVCLGVPYSTHIWQVGDAPQLNGYFKMALTKAKSKYLTYRDLDNKKFVPSDIIPLINMAWEKCFARVKPAKHAILLIIYSSIILNCVELTIIQQPTQQTIVTTLLVHPL
jgi:hypothetical protein